MLRLPGGASASSKRLTAALATVVRKPQVDIRPVRLRSTLISARAMPPRQEPIRSSAADPLGELLGEVAPDLKNPEMRTLRFAARANRAACA